MGTRVQDVKMEELTAELEALLESGRPHSAALDIGHKRRFVYQATAV